MKQGAPRRSQSLRAGSESCRVQKAQRKAAKGKTLYQVTRQVVSGAD